MRFRRILWSMASLIGLAIPHAASASVFGSAGDGLLSGLQAALRIRGPVNMPIRTFIVNVVVNVLNFVGLIAVIMIIVAGIYLVAGGGTEESKNRAKTIILYTLIGLVIILFSRVIILLALSLFA